MLKHIKFEPIVEGYNYQYNVMVLNWDYELYSAEIDKVRQWCRYEFGVEGFHASSRWSVRRAKGVAIKRFVFRRDTDAFKFKLTWC